MLIQNKRLIVIMLSAAFLLLIPFTAMQFTDEVSWSLFDFVTAAGLLFGTGLLCELVLRKVTKPGYRIAIVIAILTALFIIWAELAVGVFGTPLSGN
jgi:peptidoglycan/LPS O-acetylase OafA/YrhL